MSSLLVFSYLNKDKPKEKIIGYRISSNKENVYLYLKNLKTKFVRVIIVTYTVFAVGLQLFFPDIPEFVSINHKVKPQPTGISRVLEVSRGGTLNNPPKSKTGAGAKGRAKARQNSRFSNIFVEAFNPNVFKSVQRVPSKAIVKPQKGDLFATGQYEQANDDDNSNHDPSTYKGGPSPFKDFDYNQSDHTRQNVEFKDERRASHAYDRHKDCFPVTQDKNRRTKENQKLFKDCIDKYIQAPNTERLDGSYRYEVPAYHYNDPKSDLVVTVDAKTNNIISIRNATDFQLDQLRQPDHNLGYDARPNFSLILRLRGPKGQ